MMYVNTTTPERRKKKNAAHQYHHPSPALKSRQEEVMDESRYPASPQHRYEEMDYRIHRSIEGHRDGSDGEEQFMTSDQPVPSTQSTTSSCEVSVQSPTQLFHFMNRHLWAQAMKHLQLHPIDASVWINSSSHRNLPLHLACLMLSSSARGAPPPPPLHFMEALVRAYPDAAAEKNNEGRLPLHLASECIDISSRYLESEGILLLLSKFYPAGLTEKDREGRVPLQILEERGISGFGGKNGKSGIIRYMKSQTKIRRRSEQESDKPHDDNPSEDNLNGFVTPKKMHTAGTSNSDKRTPMSERHSRKVNQSPSTSPYRGYDLLSTPTTHHGYDLIATPGNSFHAESSSSRTTNISPAREMTNAEANRHIHASPRPSEYALMSPPRMVSSPHSFVSASKSTPTHSNNSNNNALEVRLQMMEAKYAQLQREFDNLNAIHSGTVSELKEQTKRAEESQYRINVLNESEDSRIRVNSELNARYAQLQSEFDNLNAMHSGTVTELREQTKRAGEYQYKIEVLSESEDSRIRMNSELKDDNNELEEKLSHQMRIQAELKEELNERTTQLQEMRTRESSLLQQLLKKLDNDEDRLNQEKYALIAKEKDEFAAKNILLREVAVKAIQTVGVLQKNVRLSGSNTTAQITSQSGLEQLLDAVDLSPASMKVSSQQRNSQLKASDALKMLQPIIEDAQDMQKDVTNKVQKLLQSCKTTTRLIDGIPNIPQHDFDFEATLQALAEVMSTNISLAQSMDTTLVDVEQMKINVASVTKQSPVENDEIIPCDGGDGNAKALLEVVEVTQKTSKKLESLARTISRLNFNEVNLKEEDMKKSIKAADEITKVFQLSLDHLTKDTTKIRGIADAAINANKKL
mmetsp:Transcript_8/g.6  ORF Transcript_8/g.6 Transcript_8/m.6 type:complete len:863 (+) Transcript_8:219-2807(+)